MKTLLIKGHKVILDDEDLVRVSGLTWTPVKKRKNIYFVNNHTTRKYLHQFVLGVEEGMVIDHRNRNTLDNRKENLRHTNKSVNAYNVEEVRTDNKSGFRGVSWDNSRNKWVARMKIDGKYKYLGRFDKKQDAIKIIDQKNLELFGDYRRQRTLCVGDIHGSYRALKQVLERSNFDYEKDLLITLGDIVDGLPDSYECVEELLKIRHRIDIVGNHDKWFYDWLNGKGHEPKWAQGGLATVKSYAKAHSIALHAHKSYERDIFDRPKPVYRVNFFFYQISVNHKEFFHKQAKFYVDDKNRAFVHAGYTHPEGLGHEDPYIYMWSRELWENHAMIPSQSMPKLLKPYNKIFIGHTQTLNWSQNSPMFRYNVINLDTGAGWLGGKLTIMDVETEEYWQSDLTEELYPDYKIEK